MKSRKQQPLEHGAQTAAAFYDTVLIRCSKAKEAFLCCSRKIYEKSLCRTYIITVLRFIAIYSDFLLLLRTNRLIIEKNDDIINCNIIRNPHSGKGKRDGKQTRKAVWPFNGNIHGNRHYNRLRSVF